MRLAEDLAAWCCGGWNVGAPPLSELLGRWRSLVGRFGDSRVTRRQLVRFLFAHRDPSGLCSTWLSAFAGEMLTTEIRKRLTLEETELEAFDDLVGACAEGKALAELEVATFAGKSGSSKHVSLMNIHTAKGSEFNEVIIAGLDAGRMPVYHARSDAELAEQRRLFYVALTRARRAVHLLYSGWTTNPYGRRFNDGPSPYLLEVEAALEAEDAEAKLEPENTLPL